MNSAGDTFSNFVTLQLQGFDRNLETDTVTAFNDLLRDTIVEFPWEIHRLLWIGYQNNKTNETCLFRTLSKDILLHIISYFFVDYSQFVKMKFIANTTFDDIANKYHRYLDDNDSSVIANWNNNVKNAYIRIWCQYGCICKKYPTDNVVPKKKWIHVPCSHAEKLRLNDDDINLSDYNKIIIEYSDNDYITTQLSLLDCLTLQPGSVVDHRYVQ